MNGLRISEALGAYIGGPGVDRGHCTWESYATAEVTIPLAPSAALRVIDRSRAITAPLLAWFSIARFKPPDAPGSP